MTTEEIAEQLVGYCRTGDYEKAQKELYANDAISIEPYASPAFAKETKGLPAIIEKGHKFSAMVEKIYSSSVSEPIVTANSFACLMKMDVQMKGQGRMAMSEICVYNLKDGKIISEQFHV